MNTTILIVAPFRTDHGHVINASPERPCRFSGNYEFTTETGCGKVADPAALTLKEHEGPYLGRLWKSTEDAAACALTPVRDFTVPTVPNCPICAAYDTQDPCACSTEDAATVSLHFIAFVGEWARVGMPGDVELEGGHAAINISSWGVRVVFETEAGARVLAAFPAAEQATEETEGRVAEAMADDLGGARVHCRPLPDDDAGAAAPRGHYTMTWRRTAEPIGAHMTRGDVLGWMDAHQDDEDGTFLIVDEADGREACGLDFGLAGGAVGCECHRCVPAATVGAGSAS